MEDGGIEKEYDSTSGFCKTNPTGKNAFKSSTVTKTNARAVPRRYPRPHRGASEGARMASMLSAQGTRRHFAKRSREKQEKAQAESERRLRGEADGNRRPEAEERRRPLWGSAASALWPPSRPALWVISLIDWCSDACRDCRVEGC